MGGLFVGLIAPNLFRAYYEFPIGLALCAAIAALVLARGLWPLSNSPRGLALVALAVVLCGYLWFVGGIMRRMVHGYRVATRNFYGQLRVYDEGNAAEDDDAVRKFIHGTIDHGE